MQNLTKLKMKTYPEWTVDTCICFVGHFRIDCPYATPQEEEYNKIRLIAKDIEFD